MSTQTITLECRVAGRIVPHVLEVSTSAGFDQINAEATIWTTARPGWADERQDAEIYARNSATGQGWLFRGEVTGFDWTYAPTKVGIICGDFLSRTRDGWGGDDYDYTSQTSDAIVRNGLEKKSIPSSRAHIEGSGWVVGTIEPLTLKSGDDVYATLIAPLDDLEGYRTFSLTSGVIVRLRVTGAVGGGTALTITQGVEVLSNPRHTRTAQGIVNRVIITGVEYEGLTVGGPGVGEASAPNPYVTDPSGFVTERVQSNLVEDDPTALLFAQQRVADKNRRPEAGEFRIPLDPRVQPGMRIRIVHPGLEFGSAAVLAQHVAHSVSSAGATTTIRTSGGGVGGAVLLPPVANFTIETFLEGEDTGSGVTAVVVLICDGSQSYDPDGTIASYAWTITTDGTATPSSGSGAVLRSVVTGASTITVTLTVTDNDGETGALTLTQAVDTSTMLIEDLYLAYGDAACSSDGEQTWRTETPSSGSATCLMPLATTWQAWGTDTGHIYATFDKLITPLVDLGAPHGSHAVTAVWIHETDTTRLWAGFDDGYVYAGVVDLDAQSATFTLAGTIPDSPVHEVRESYGTFGELRATAGASYYYSTDGGASWSVQHTFDTAWRMAAGFDTNLSSGLNDSAPIYDEDGAPPTLPGGVTHVRGISFGWRQPELYAADDGAALYLGASPSFDLALHADSTDAIVNHMIRSGNIDRVVYMAIGDGTGSNNGFQKWIPDAAPPFYIKKTASSAGLMIGYGALHLPPVVATLLMVGGNLSAGTGVKRWAAGAWSDVSGDLPSASWTGICASPLNKSHWIVWNDSVAYRTTNAGVNWTQISGIGDSLSALALEIRQCEFSPSVLTAWALTGRAHDTFFLVDHGFVERGDTNDVTEDSNWVSDGGPGHVPVDQTLPTSLSYTAGDDLVVALESDATYGDRWLRFSGMLSGLGLSVAPIPATCHIIDGIAGRTAVYGLASAPSGAEGDLWTDSATILAHVTNDATGVAAAALDAIYAGTADGVMRLAYAGGGGSVVAAAGLQPTFVRAGRQTRTAVGALVYDVSAYPSAPFRVLIFDGSTWVNVAAAGDFGPTGYTAPWLEVIG